MAMRRLAVANGPNIFHNASCYYCGAVLYTGDVGGHLPTALLPPTSLDEVESSRCAREDSGWSACSTSCGPGVSARLSNDNEQCVGRSIDQFTPPDTTQLDRREPM